MKLIILLISLLALVLSYEAYERTRSLQPLTQLSNAVSEAQSVSHHARKKIPGARESAGDLLIDLGHKVKGKDGK